METVTVSSEFQIEIPQTARELLGIQAGQQIQELLYDDRIGFIPVKPVSWMRGFLKEIDTTIDRDDDRI